MEKVKEKESEDREIQVQKEPYMEPELIELGDLARETHKGAGSFCDSTENWDYSG